MVDEQTEQTPEVSAEQNAPVPEQVEPVAESEVGAVAAEDGAVAEREVETPAIDWSRPDEVRRVLEAPEYRGIRDLLEEQRLNSENTAKQRFEADMRRQAASDEVLAQAAQGLARELGVADDDEAVRRYVQSFAQPHSQRAVTETAKAWIDGAKSILSDEGKQGIDMALSLAEDDPEKLVSIVNQLWTGYGQTIAQNTLNDVSLESVPASSRLRKEIDEHVAKQVEAELKARDTAASAIDPGPSASTGIAPGTTRDQEIDHILQTAPASSKQYADAYQTKYGFALVGGR